MCTITYCLSFVTVSVPVFSDVRTSQSSTRTSKTTLCTHSTLTIDLLTYCTRPHDAGACIACGMHAITITEFLPRDAMHKRGICCRWVSVCPSVRPSVRPPRWCILSTRLNLTLVFLTPCADTQFQGEPL